MKFSGKIVFSVLMVAVIALSTVAPVLAKDTGPSSSQSPYLVPSQPDVSFKAILTVGDSVNLKPDGTPYRMVGIPDGLGAFDNKDGTFTLLMNHELNGSVGITRAHGAPGAFISKWIIRKKDLRVVSGEDLIRNVMSWNTTTYQYEPATVTFSRFCSADLPAVSAFYDSRSRRGYKGLIYMNGEEAGAEGRAFAHLMDGTSYELPWLGKFSWENSVANPGTRKSTVVAGLDDSGGGQVYFYVGEKTRSENPVEAAGLTNGNLFSIKVDGLDSETDSTVLNGPVPFTAYNFGDVSSMTGAELEAASKDENGAYRVTSFQRPEDGVWDPKNPDDFYFVTTASFTGNSRLWRIRFHDPAEPEAGGTIEMLLDGSEGQKMMDNIAINKHGQIIIQEDPGNQPYLARIWLYSLKRDTLTEIAQHDPERFSPGAAGFITQDEESSGVIDASSILGRGWYLLVQEVHLTSTDAELVEGGQLLAMRISREREHEDD
ncbi:MAG: DUF839 domain-containing protein [Chloroflexi bacterium]|nr:MAG: DUF839 domain-containing protein [Chloroflexota bacterium]